MSINIKLCIVGYYHFPNQTMKEETVRIEESKELSPLITRSFQSLIDNPKVDEHIKDIINSASVFILKDEAGHLYGYLTTNNSVRLSDVVLKKSALRFVTTQYQTWFSPGDDITIMDDDDSVSSFSTEDNKEESSNILRNNRTIVIGNVTIDWKLTKGCFSCSCSNAQSTNAFDRVICGILYRSNGSMLKSDIASIIGFNVIDNIVDNRYVDQSEKTIFDNAVASLVEYNLVIDNGFTLKLTEAGKVAFETRTKHRTEEKDIELWTSEFIGPNFDPEVLKGLQINSIDMQNHPEWNTLIISPEDVLQIQKAELVDINAGRRVDSLICNSIDYYVAKLSCKICFDVEQNELFTCSALKSEELDSLLSANSLLQDYLLDEFFNEQNVSVIYKPAHQKDIEDFIVKQQTTDASFTNVISCKSEFLSKVSNIIKDDNISIVYFSLQKLTPEIRDSIKQIKSAIVCVDYVDNYVDEFKDSEQNYIEENVCYHHVIEIRTTDLCVWDNTYYSPLPYVVNYKGTDYNIQLLYEYNGSKYNHTVLYSPFANHILRRSSYIQTKGIDAILRSPLDGAVKIANNLIKNNNRINEVKQLYTDPGHVKSIDNINEATGKLINAVNDALNNEISSIQTKIKEGVKKEEIIQSLKKLELSIKEFVAIDNDLLSRLIEVRNELDKKVILQETKIVSRTVYILDTSVFMYLPKVLDRFNLSRDRVIVPRAMEQELDGLSHNEEKKANANIARLSLRRKKIDYPHFVSIKDNVNRDLLPTGFDKELKDNDMLATAIEISSNNTYDRIVIVAVDDEFVSNVNDCVSGEVISSKIESINLDELLIRLSE